MLTAPLVARRGKVPPATGAGTIVTLNRQTTSGNSPVTGAKVGPYTIQTMLLTSGQAVTNTVTGMLGQTPTVQPARLTRPLKRKKAYFNVLEASLSPPKKRVRDAHKRAPTPYPS